MHPFLHILPYPKEDIVIPPPYTIMKNILVCLAMLAATLCVKAEKYYIHLTDGQILGYPKELVKSTETSGDEYRLTLLNDSVITWKKTEVKAFSDAQPVFPKLTALTFKDELNDELTDNVKATLTDDGRAIASVAAIGRYLTPTFSMSQSDAKVYVDGVEQVSGVSRRRFADEVTYTVAMPMHQQLTAVKLTDEVWSETGVTTEEIALKADMLSTNAPTSQAGEGLDMMLDGDPSTLFHSTWSQDKVYEVDLSKQVYVQVELKKAIKGFQFYYISRMGTDRYNIQEWRIEASNDGQQWKEVTLLDEANGLPVSGQGITYTSPVINMDAAYSYLRFTASRVGYKNYLCLSEFRLYEVTDNGENSTLLQPATYAYQMTPMGSRTKVCIDWLTEQATSVPRIDINIDGGVTVTSKDYYLNAQITIQGQGVWPDFQDSVQIKGRGNTSWDNAKKPYRLKFANSVKPFGWKKGKNWNLLAQAQTGSMMSNPIAMKIARMVDAAAANDVMPVELYMNGKYLGSYIFTQKTGLANNSVDLEDESQASFLELDRYFDETYKFYSSNYGMPVNVKEPDLAEKEETILTLTQIQNDFNQFEGAVKQNNHFERFVDMDKLVRFMLVNELVLNTEIGHPKSVFLYRENLNDMNTAYTFGPVWDFDWAFGYESNRNYCTTGATTGLFNFHTSSSGNRFFSALWNTSPWVKHRYYQLWTDFMKLHLQELLDYVDDYYAFAKPSFLNNQKKWGDGNGYETRTAQMKQWLSQRANHLMRDMEKKGYGKEQTPFTFGDLNKDGNMDETDVDNLLSYLLGKTVANSSFTEQADINNDGRISATDLAWLCSQKTHHNPTQIVSQTMWSQWDMTDTENSQPVALNASETEEGNTWEISTQFTNNLPYVALCMDFTLPQGITDVAITKGNRANNTHNFEGRFLSKTLYRIIGYSPANQPFDNTEGTLFALTMTSDGTLQPGTYPIQAGHINFVKSNGNEVTFNDVRTTLRVTANHIHENLITPLWPADIYDLQGRIIRHQATSTDGLPKGIYLINHRKVVVK